MNEYDIIVIGGGHAGAEAAHISAKLNCKTLLITQKISTISLMPCNPSIGGPAKGVVVREISALGGLIGNVSDLSYLQTKVLNTKKGPGVWAIRNQIDKDKYHYLILKELENQSNLTIVENMAEGIDKLSNGDICIITKDNKFISKKVIITTGTYTSSKLMMGKKKWTGAPNNLKSSSSISCFLQKHNINLIRLDTGTPPRADMSTINIHEMTQQNGNNNTWTFGVEKKLKEINIPCYLTYTTKDTNEIVKKHLETSQFFHGNNETIGPARCPSIETKVMKFEREDKHPLFVEPDNKDYSIAYIQGLNTALSEEAQQAIINTIPGLRKARITQYGYAIEYDAIQPTQLMATLEIKKIPNVYSAGQINGSSGYEEAAAQGLIAGINAALSIKEREPLILSRDDSYIGMLIDDMIMKGVTEPYRLLTSMMTYRMYVRSDNAYIRMNSIARMHNLLNNNDQQTVDEYINKEKSVINFLMKYNLKMNSKLFSYLSKIMNVEGRTLFQTLKDSRVTLRDVIKIDNSLDQFKLTRQELEMININIKYEGYIRKEKNIIERINKKNSQKLPNNIDYSRIQNISDGAIEKLNMYKPQTIGQARQLEKVTISDIINIEKHINK